MKAEHCAPEGMTWAMPGRVASLWGKRKVVKPQLFSVHCYKADSGTRFGVNYSQHEDVRELDAAEFESLVATWTAETRGFSAVGDIVMHEAYQRIMAAGKTALPFILSDLADNPRHWFHALTFIVGRDVAADASNFRSARAAWIEWGYRNNYI